MTITTIEPLRAAAGSCGLVAGDPAQIAEISPTRLDGDTLAVIRAGQKIYCGSHPRPVPASPV